MYLPYLEEMGDVIPGLKGILNGQTLIEWPTILLALLILLDDTALTDADDVTLKVCGSNGQSTNVKRSVCL